MRLLAALEMLAALANPLLAFKNQVGKLIADFEGEELQQAQPEEQVYLNIFVILSLGQGALQNFGEQFAEPRMVRRS